MTKPFNNQKVRAIITALRPWALSVLLVLILYFTGALNGMAFLTQSALMKSGLMGFDAEKDAARGTFDYNFTIRNLKGDTVDFRRFKGKVVFINLWATWCGPCRFEMPSIERLYNSVDHEKVAFVMLSIDTQETQSKISRYINEKQFTFPVYVPGEYLPEQLRVRSIPTTFVIAKDGKIAAKKVGAAEYDTKEFRAFLDELTK